MAEQKPSTDGDSTNKPEKKRDYHLPIAKVGRRSFLAGSAGAALTGVTGGCEAMPDGMVNGPEPVLSLRESDEIKSAMARVGFGVSTFAGAVNYIDAAKRLFDDAAFAASTVSASAASGMVQVGEVSVPLNTIEGQLLVALGNSEVRNAALSNSPTAFVQALETTGIMQRALEATEIGKLAEIVGNAISAADRAQLDQILPPPPVAEGESWTLADVHVSVEAQVDLVVEVVAVGIAAIVALITSPTLPDPSAPTLPSTIAAALGSEGFAAQVNEEALRILKAQVTEAVAATSELPLREEDFPRIESLADAVVELVYGGGCQRLRINNS
jgi:hypothetical protein